MFKFLTSLFGDRPAPPTESPRNEAAASNENAMRTLLQGETYATSIDVTDRTALRVSTVYACLAKLGGAILQLPLHQYSLSLSGERERTPNSPLWWMLNESPHPDWTAASWKEWIVHCVALRGDQFTQIIRGNAGQITGLLPLHPDCVTPRKAGGMLIYRVMDGPGGQSYAVPREDMLHFSGYGFNGCHSLSIIQWAARSAVRNSLAAAEHAGQMLTAGTAQKFALLAPGTVSKEQRDAMRDSFDAAYTGPQNGRRPFILSGGITLKELSLSAVDLQLLEGRKFEREDICRAFGVPPILIGDTEKASSWGTGIEQITIGFVKFTLKPHLARWEEELNRKLFRRAGTFVEFELDGLLRGDSKAQAEAFRAAIGGPGTGDGWMTVNEVRRLKNLPPLPGAEHDTLFKAQRGAPPT